MNLDHTQLYAVLADMQKDIKEIAITQSSMAKDVEHHIRRSELLESKVEFLEKKVFMWMGAIAIAGWVAATAIPLIIKYVL